MNFRDWLKSRLDEFELSPTELARQSGDAVNQPTIQRILKGTTASPKEGTINAVVSALNIVLRKRGISPLSYIQHDAKRVESEPSNFEQAPTLKGRVPLISYVQAGAFVEAIDNLAPGEGEEWIEVTCPVRSYTFALRVVGDSMEPDFPAGTIIVIEPDMAPDPGDFVIAKNGDGEATFKQLTRDGADWYLKPLNPRYPIKPLDKSRIIGVVRQAVRQFR